MSRVVLAVLVIALIAVSAAWAGAVGEDAVIWPRSLMAATVILGAVGFGRLTRNASSRKRADAEGSLEQELSLQVRANVFTDSLILLSLAGLLLLVLRPEINPGFVVFGLVALLTLDFYVRYAIATRRSVRA